MCPPLPIVIQVAACCRRHLSSSSNHFPQCRLRPSRSCLRAAFPPFFPACAARSPNGRLFLPPSLIQAAPFLPLLPRWAPPLRMLPLTSPPLTRVVTHCPCQSAYIRSCVTCRAFASYSNCRYPFDHHSVLSAYDTGSVRRGFQVHVAFLNSQPWLRRAAGVQAGLCVVPRS
jgi:hypothetical protein